MELHDPTQSVKSFLRQPLVTTNSIDGGSAPGDNDRWANPYRVESNFDTRPWALPTSIEFVPFADGSNRKIDF